MCKELMAMLQVTRKEFRAFFATPAAYLFLGAFLAVCLFVFFWVEAFFARNIADVKPLFQWLPLLLVFLVAALTMRAWSEERRSGTLESLLTAPVKSLSLVLGKFTAAMGLVLLALVLTLPIPVTVSLLGPLDWGPVIGGYVATLFMAAAYASIGLYMSSRTDNPIVALILTVVVCSIFYLIGSPTLTNFFGHDTAELFAFIGTGARFESITRGVIDLRDIYYYISLVGIFLTLNVFTLERLRWTGNPPTEHHKHRRMAVTLVLVNFFAANLWLTSINTARVDITHDKLYSLSDATQQQLARVQEPLLIRGYFSAKTHPLLNPLVPQIKDLLEEYAVAADGQARVELVDPTQDSEAEDEAAYKYGIKPIPFQTADRYQAAVVSSYFDIVIAYGDQFELLGFRDLIEVKPRGENDMEVVLKNPEYAITRAIRKVTSAYQAGGNLFDQLKNPVTFKGYISATHQLPETLQTLRDDLDGILQDLSKTAGDKLKVSFEDPGAGNGQLAEKLQQDFGFGPQIASLLDPTPFWFYMVLETDNQTVQIPLPEALDKASLERSINAAVKRLTPGSLKTIAVVKPPSLPPQMMGMGGGGGHQYNYLETVLGENLRLIQADLNNGLVPDDADLLLVLAPKELDDKQRFAIDQFLMQGGSVVIATSPFDVQINSSLSAENNNSGLTEWLELHGINVEQTLVLDPQNAALPVPVERTIGGLTVQEVRMLPYPHFPDLRGDELNQDSPVTANLDQITLNWVSPITLDDAKNQQRKITRLLRTSDDSWTSEGLNMVPDFAAYPDSGFAVEGEQQSHWVAVAVEGRFDSFYQGKESPLVESSEQPAEQQTTEEGEDKQEKLHVTSVIEHSPEAAKLVVVASNTFATDTAIDLASQGMNTFYSKPMDFLQNVVDWSLEDSSLLALRGRTQLARTLKPLSPGEQGFWEAANYGVALAGLLAVWFWRRRITRKDRKRYQQLISEV